MDILNQYETKAEPATVLVDLKCLVDIYLTGFISGASTMAGAFAPAKPEEWCDALGNDLVEHALDTREFRDSVVTQVQEMSRGIDSPGWSVYLSEPMNFGSVSNV